MPLNKKMEKEKKRKNTLLAADLQHFCIIAVPFE